MMTTFPNRGGYMPTGMSPASSLPNGPVPVVLPPSNAPVPKSNIRILCVADVRGDLLSLNELARKANADYILHTGDFGFYDDSSIHRIADKTLRHVAQYSPLLSEATKKAIQGNPNGLPIKTRLADEKLSQLPKFLDKTYQFDVPIYTVWGACEDVGVLEKFRSGEYKIEKLHIIDEASSRLLDIGAVKLRLLGLGGAVVMHKLFDNGEGKTTIAGGQGTMWTTLLQMGELLDTANRVYDASETRVFITHSSPAREGLLNALSVALKADFSISAGLHFRYGSSYNEFSVNPTLDHYRGKLAASKASFNDVWETVKGEVLNTVAQNPAQKQLLENAINIIEKMPSTATGPNPFGGTAPGTKGEVDESAFKNMWGFNLADASFGWLVLDVENGRIGAEMRTQGFNFAHRAGKAAGSVAASSSNAIGSPAPETSLQPAQTTPVASLPTVVNTQASIPPTNQPPRVPSAPRRDEPVKPATPINVPPRTGSATPSKPVPVTAQTTVAPVRSEDSRNGTPAPAVVEAGSKETATDAPITGTPPLPSAEEVAVPVKGGLYVTGVTGEEAVKELFSESDRELIDHIDEKLAKTNKNLYYLVFFKDPSDVKPVLERLRKDLTTRSTDRSRPYVMEIDDDQRINSASTERWRRGGMGRGRGGDNFRSSASESEGPGGASADRGGGRNRGFGGRGRGDRQSFEGGGRGGGGGGRGGRGGGRKFRDPQSDGPTSAAT